MPVEKSAFVTGTMEGTADSPSLMLILSSFAPLLNLLESLLRELFPQRQVLGNKRPSDQMEPH